MKREINRTAVRSPANGKVWLAFRTNPGTGVDVRYKERAPGYTFCGDRHDFWELLYVDQGSVRIVLDQREHTVCPGEFVVIARRQPHSVLPSSGTAPFYITAHFQTNLMGLNDLVNAVLPADEDGRRLLTDMLREKGSEDFGADELAQAYLLEFLIRAIRRHRGQAGPVVLPTYFQANADHKAVAKAIEFLTTHFPKPLTLDNIARAAGLSSSHLEHLFKKNTGLSVMSFLQSLRIQAAKRLLLESPLNVSQIAEKIGYSSIHLFSRRFKKSVSIPPSRYAKMVRLAATAESRQGQNGSKRG